VLELEVMESSVPSDFIHLAAIGRARSVVLDREQVLSLAPFLAGAAASSQHCSMMRTEWRILFHADADSSSGS